MNKPADNGEVTRYVVEHIHRPAEDKRPGSKGKKPDPRIGRAKRLKEQIELLEERVKEALDTLESHPLVADIEEAHLAAEWIDREIQQRQSVATYKMDKAMAHLMSATDCQEKAEDLQKEAARLRESARELKQDATNLQAEDRRSLACSRNTGPHGRLQQLQKEYNTKTHRVSRQGREAEQKAAKLRAKLAVLLEEIAPLLEGSDD